MIRLCHSTCKTYKKLKNCNELFILQNSSEDISFYPCSSCSCPPDNYVKNGSYTRSFICVINGKIKDESVIVNVKKCSSCNHSHALLHYLIVPYSRYSLGFLVTLIYFKLTNRFGTVKELCAHFGISIKTYHRIIKRLKQDSHALIMAMDEYSDILSMIKILCRGPFKNIPTILNTFFKVSGHSFLQPCVTLRLTWNST